jgi:hypothetical protein
LHTIASLHMCLRKVSESNHTTSQLKLVNFFGKPKKGIYIKVLSMENYTRFFKNIMVAPPDVEQASRYQTFWINPQLQGQILISIKPS